MKVGFLLLWIGITGSGCGSKQAQEPPPGPPPAAGDCAKSGCSGTLCVEPGKEMVTTCEWKEEYACYQDAACERQSDGSCGWTRSDALDSCLAAKAAQPGGGEPAPQ
ncbi:MAG TPA: hypothetical protein VL172_23445 [Kofleriaceae bacterium]|nr:hypothetical protein [Kofleriaceae bacterium]